MNRFGLYRNTEGHTHTWSEPYETKVLLRNEDPSKPEHQRGTVVGYDLLTQQQCSDPNCKQVRTLDMKRVRTG